MPRRPNILSDGRSSPRSDLLLYHCVLIGQIWEATLSSEAKDAGILLTIVLADISCMAPDVFVLLLTYLGRSQTVEDCDLLAFPT